MKKIILSLVVASALAGCKQEPVEVVQSVDWYKENTAERIERLAKCRSNPGELEDTPNCINAEQAESIAESKKRGGLNVQPMTGIKLGR
ncbi:EexN family lipoprotein [Salmonella enterica]|uniref:EexN family lipoprotein n=1 Tax=Salmonella enterica TaxID=28901 RepID=UPI00241236AE|nr:EexN family lipoprotein [Salmonella enterica]EIM6481046.1 EexN family lipoprotein [Salmonella enterica subsp. enterica serovar Kentucky]EIT6427092.1 EexN family lipoprotein [Salmonella enterica]EJH4740244.1 EexN family lipoprotein [Salmonella enterica subsp. enterica serovar Kentucky]EJH9749481.1 EexN family lipoprotein [Salmonella enterica subsp. enterica serovar Kentucky]EJM4449220.1 EexN family lipoprotein [Salmonella enterica subsp. enterica serovar Kentucky]